MCETETLKLITQTVRGLPEPAAREVLAFAEFLKARQPEPKILAPEVEADLYAELRAQIEVLPMQAESAGNFMRRIRDEARY